MTGLAAMPIWFVPALVLASFLYSQVGHGGASAYLALGALAGMAPHSMRPAALVLNLVVAGLSTLAFSRQGHQRARLLLVLALGSVPAAWWAARLPMDPATLRRLLGCLLVLAAIRLWLPKELKALRAAWIPEPKPAYLLTVGVLLGALAGLTGVGGGIYLSPLLMILGWASAKETAAISSAFILLNSGSALASLSGQGLPSLPWTWVTACLFGGLAGSWFGSTKLPEQALRRALALVLALASVKLLGV